MRKAVVASVIAGVLAASAAFAAERPAIPPVRETEGVDTGASHGVPSAPPVRGVEGPDTR